MDIGVIASLMSDRIDLNHSTSDLKHSRQHRMYDITYETPAPVKTTICLALDNVCLNFCISIHLKAAIYSESIHECNGTQPRYFLSFEISMSNENNHFY